MHHSDAQKIIDELKAGHRHESYWRSVTRVLEYDDGEYRYYQEEPSQAYGAHEFDRRYTEAEFRAYLLDLSTAQFRRSLQAG